MDMLLWGNTAVVWILFVYSECSSRGITVLASVTCAAIFADFEVDCELHISEGRAVKKQVLVASALIEERLRVPAVRRRKDGAGPDGSAISSELHCLCSRADVCAVIGIGLCPGVIIVHLEWCVGLGECGFSFHGFFFVSKW